MFEQIKKWLNATGGKYIIVENKKPKYVILKIEDFEELINAKKDQEINQEIIALKQEEPIMDMSLDKK